MGRRALERRPRRGRAVWRGHGLPPLPALRGAEGEFVGGAERVENPELGVILFSAQPWGHRGLDFPLVL